MRPIIKNIAMLLPAIRRLVAQRDELDQLRLTNDERMQVVTQELVAQREELQAANHERMRVVTQERDVFAQERDILAKHLEGALGERDKLLLELKVLYPATPMPAQLDATSAPESGSHPATLLSRASIGKLSRIVMAAESCMSRERRDFLERLDHLREFFLASQQSLPLEEKLRLLKVLNLLVVKYEYRNRYSRITARPVGFLLDANNTCQLGCEACVHTFDREYAKVFNVPRPGVMKHQIHDRIMEQAGIYSFMASYYNKSEPLLNKNIHGFLVAASKRRVYTRISSNLSLPKLDADALVLSGLNMLDVSIDGATQATYERYRRGGNIDWIFQNVRNLVAAKRRHSRMTPVIRWKYLTFEHNIQEAESAFEMARELGFDEISYSMPYPGPTVVPAPHPTYTPDGNSTTHTFNTPLRDSWVFETENGEISEQVERALSESFIDRYERLKSAHSPGFDERTPGFSYCDWLHYNTAFDAHGVIRPCCEGDYKARGGFDFSDVSREADFLNSERYVLARKFTMGDPSVRKSGTTSGKVGCLDCKFRPGPEANLGGVDAWLQFFGNRITADHLGTEPLAALTDWSRHHHEGVIG